MIANATAIPGSHSATGTTPIATCTNINANRPANKATISLTRGHLRTHTEMYMTHEHHSASAVYSLGMSGITPTVFMGTPLVANPAGRPCRQVLFVLFVLFDGVAEIRG